MFENWLNSLNALTHREDVTTGQVMRAFAVEQTKPVPKRGAVPYVMFQISTEAGEEITAPIAAALRIVRRPGCRCEATLSTVMFVTFQGQQGNREDENDEAAVAAAGATASAAAGATGGPLGLRDVVADELLRKLGRRVRLIKGTVEGVVGQIGRGNSFFNGTAFRGIEKLCAGLFAQAWGTRATLNLVPASARASNGARVSAAAAASANAAATATSESPSAATAAGASATTSDA